jgi:hypothetical protein
VSPKSPGCALLAFIGIAAFCALMLGVVGAAIAPAALKIPAAILCPEGTVEAVVVRYVTHPEPGTTSVSGVLHCLDASGCATTPSEFLPHLILFGLAFGLVILILLPLYAIGARRERESARPSGGLQSL